MTTTVHTRIALSPTGHLHVDTARLAIYNWMLARHSGGKYLVRIEDLDVCRPDVLSIETKLKTLKWMGLDWDGSVVYQSGRKELYRHFGQLLLDSGHAYRCFCGSMESTTAWDSARPTQQSHKRNHSCLHLSPAEINAKLEVGLPFAVCLRIPEGDTRFVDIVSGAISRKNEDINNFMLLKSDGLPTCSFAAVIDDHEMGVTHNILGDDHLTNTFQQIHLYRALGWDCPEFGHVPMIHRSDARGALDRSGESDVAALKEEGILSQALVNYLCLSGRSSENGGDVFTAGEMVQQFNPHRLSQSYADIDEEKLFTLNKVHIQKMSDHDLAVLVAPLLVDAGVTTKYWLETRWVYLRQVITLLRDRVSRLTDFVRLGGYFFSFDGGYEPEAAARQFNPESAQLLEELAKRFEKLDDFTQETAGRALESLADKKGLKRACLIHPTRLAVSGMLDGPELYDLLVVLTRPIVLTRLKKAIEYIRRNHQITQQG